MKLSYFTMSSLKLACVFICGFSSLKMPLQAQEGYYSQGSSWKEKALLVGGAAVVGGVVACLFNTRHHHHHHHSSSSSTTQTGGGIGPAGPTGPMGPVGPVGPTGPAGTFPVNPAETLTVTSMLTDITIVGSTPLNASTTLTFTPYITYPNGTVDVGTPVIVPNVVNGPIAPVTFSNFTVTAPQIGSYEIGVQIDAAPNDNVGTFNIVSATLSAEVETAGGLTTYVQEAFGDPAIDLITNSQVQIHTQYTYEPSLP